jgi:DNA-binding CsgD family transcriptional regulator
MLGWQAYLLFRQGRWGEAEIYAEEALGNPNLAVVISLPALTTLAYIYMRRGDPRAKTLLDQALANARQTNEIQRIVPVLWALTEAAWLDADESRLRRESDEAYQLAVSRPKNSWILGASAFWMWRAGALSIPPEGIPAAYALHMTGNWRASSEAWKRIGCPYEQACVLADGGESAQLQALHMFEKLGASPAAYLVRKSLKGRGVRSIPRGPRNAARQNPFGLTTRQSEILELIASGMSNNEVAGRLFISPRTVEHHIKAVLMKLEVTTRQQAMALAWELNLVHEDE